MAQKTRPKTEPPAARKPRWKRRLFVAVAVLVPAWLLFSHFVVRTWLERRLEATFQGTAEVKWALLWPHLDATAFDVSVTGDSFRLGAGRVGIGLRVWGVFGGRAVTGISVHDFEVDVTEGQDLHLFHDHSAEGADAGAEADLDPLRLPPIRCNAARVVFHERDGGARAIFRCAPLDLDQTGDRAFDLRTGGGTLGPVPFERLTGRLIPRGDHLLVNDLKLRAFNGIVGGVLDVDLEKTGAFNGELEWHFVETGSVWKTYGLPYIEKRRGDLSGEVVFEAARPSLAALEGKGSLRLKRGRFFSPISFQVFLVLKVPVAAEARLTDGDLTFSFEKEVLFLERARANARGFHLDGQGIITFDGQADLEISHAGTTVAVRGDLEDPLVKVLPLDGITKPFDRLFRERVGKR